MSMRSPSGFIRPGFDPLKNPDAPTIGTATGGNALWANQNDGSTRTNTIQYITIASTGNAVDFGDTTVTRNQLAGVGSSTRAVFCGGTTGTSTNVMDYVAIDSTGNATDFGDLSIACRLAAGASSSTQGVIAVGQDASNNPTNIMDYITIASTGNAIDFGDLLSNLNQMAGISNCHGGIA
jgi:hypothetical protein